MPNSIMSHMSVVGQPKTQMASFLAREAAQQEIRRRVATGQLDPRDVNSIKREFKDIYSQEYYKNYAELMRQDQPPERVIYLATENPAARKFYVKHAVASFTKTNLFIKVHKDCITVGRLNFPLDEEISLETKEAFLGVWPGPLDKPDESVKRKTTDYIDTLWQHDSQRRIRYMNSSSDEQRRVILKLLTELLHRNGSLDASGTTRLLLKPDQTEIQKDEGNRRPVETLQKYLLLGKRSEAIKFAKSRKLWDHAQCLAYLDKYQPQNKRDYVKDGPRLRDDSIVQLNDEYINSVDQSILKTVYRSLLNRILQKDPDSVNLIKHPSVDNDPYLFAILSANDCEMEFDQSNEIFKLVNAMKKTPERASMSNSHLISLGFTTIDTPDVAEDLSYRSILSFRQNDTYASRTLTISNIDMLIMNEIWEYCLNLARGTTDPASYDYIFNLIPFKLVFAARLLDYGLHRMFAYYLMSIKNALIKVRQQMHIERDESYDWDTIQRSVEYLSNVWDIYRYSPDFMNQDVQSYESPNQPMAPQAPVAPVAIPPAFDIFQSPPIATATPATQPYDNRMDQFDTSATQDYSWPPYQGNNDNFHSSSSIRETSGYGANEGVENHQVSNQDVHSLESPLETISQSAIDPPSLPSAFDTFQPPPMTQQQHHQPPLLPPPPPPVTGQSYDDRRDHRDSITQDYSSPWPPYQGDNEFPSSPPSRRESSGNGPTRNAEPQRQQQPQQQQSQQQQQPQQQQQGQQAKIGEAQGPGFIANLAGSVRAFLPKSNSKQMILPDDSKPAIVFDKERNSWVDTSKPEGENNDDYNEPPPVAAPVRAPPTYSFAPKSVKNRCSLDGSHVVVHQGSDDV